MFEKLGELRPYVVQVISPTGEPIGTGFVCHPEGYILTCWHVMDSWLDADAEQGEVLIGGDHTPANWVTELSDKIADVAVLKIAVPKDQEIPFLPLDVHWRVSLADQLRAFGYPEGRFKEPGIGVSPQMQSLTPTEVDGVTVFPLKGFNLDDIDSGYSGAPIVDEDLQKVIGLVHATQHQSKAYMVPLTPLFTGWQQLRSVHDVFEHIRQRLGVRARERMEWRLRGAPYLPLKLDIGKVPETEEEQLRIQPDAEPREYTHGRSWKPFDSGQLLPPRGKYVLSSDAGTGKTLFVDWLAAEIVQHTTYVPVVFSCEEIERLSPKGLTDLLQAILGKLDDEFLRVDLDAFLLRAKEKSELVFILDGLDQIPSGKPTALIRHLHSLVTQYSLLITTRPSAVLAIESDPALMFLRLKPFSPDDQRCYFGECYAQAKVVCAHAPDLTEIPMLASMVRNLLIKGVLIGTTTRTDLYDSFVDHILIKHQSNQDLNDTPGLVGRVRSALSRFAYEALAKDEPHIQRVPIGAYQDEASVPLPSLIGFGLVNRVLAQSEEALFFTHQSFQEFLAAKYVADRPDEIKRILTERWNPKWIEVIRFLVGFCGQEIVKKILADPDNVIHSNLFLSAACVGEFKEKADPLVEQIKSRLLDLTSNQVFARHAVASFSRLGPLLGPTDYENFFNWMETNRSSEGDFAFHALLDLAHQLDQHWLSKLVSTHYNDLVVLKSLGDLLDTTSVHKILESAANDAKKNYKVNKYTLKWKGTEFGSAVKGLSETKIEEIIDSSLLMMIDSTSRNKRIFSLYVLSSLNDQLKENAIDQIAYSLEDASPVVQGVAAETLSKLGSRLKPLYISEIILLYRSKDFEARHMAEIALQALLSQSPGSVFAAFESLLNCGSWHKVHSALLALRKLRIPLESRLIDLAKEKVWNKNWHVRATAIRTLYQLGGRLEDDEIEDLSKSLKRQNKYVRLAFHQECGNLNELSCVTSSSDHMNSLRDRFEGNLQTLAILSEIDREDESPRGEELIEYLQNRISNLNDDIRESTAEWLAASPMPLSAENIETMISRLKEKYQTYEVGQYLIDALVDQAIIRDNGSIHCISELLQIDDSGIQEKIIESLGKLDHRVPSEAVTFLVNKLNEPPPIRPPSGANISSWAIFYNNVERERGEDGVRQRARRSLEALYRAGVELPSA